MRQLKITLLVAALWLFFPSLSFVVARSQEGFLRGTFIVRCPSGHDDEVGGITRNHDCEKCGKKAVDGGTAHFVCPDGHDTRVEGITESHLCSQPLAAGGICGKQCRR